MGVVLIEKQKRHANPLSYVHAVMSIYQRYAEEIQAHY
jgi:hypothetical protein